MIFRNTRSTTHSVEKCLVYFVLKTHSTKLNLNRLNFAFCIHGWHILRRLSSFHSCQPVDCMSRLEVLCVRDEHDSYKCLNRYLFRQTPKIFRRHCDWGRAIVPSHITPTSLGARVHNKLMSSSRLLLPMFPERFQFMSSLTILNEVGKRFDEETTAEIFGFRDELVSHREDLRSTRK